MHYLSFLFLLSCRRWSSLRLSRRGSGSRWRSWRRRGRSRGGPRVGAPGVLIEGLTAGFSEGERQQSRGATGGRTFVSSGCWLEGGRGRSCGGQRCGCTGCVNWCHWVCAHCWLFRRGEAAAAGAREIWCAFFSYFLWLAGGLRKGPAAAAGGCGWVAGCARNTPAPTHPPAHVPLSLTPPLTTANANANANNPHSPPTQASHPHTWPPSPRLRALMQTRSTPCGRSGTTCSRRHSTTWRARSTPSTRWGLSVPWLFPLVASPALLAPRKCSPLLTLAPSSVLASCVCISLWGCHALGPDGSARHASYHCLLAPTTSAPTLPPKHCTHVHARACTCTHNTTLPSVHTTAPPSTSSLAPRRS